MNYVPNESTLFQRLKLKLRMRRALKELSNRAARSNMAKPHGLPAPLIVSLTSYATRFPTLARTLTGILHQTVGADRTILWVSNGDFTALPKDVLALQEKGLEIGRCDNMRSFTKIIPTLDAHPDSFIITVDDDVYYDQNLIADLVEAYDHGSPKVVCRRAHKVTLTPEGKPLPYAQWDKIRQAEECSPLVFPTGVMGVLYPPDVFHEDVCKRELFMDICSTADDVWLYWMWRMKGHTAHRIGGRRRLMEWPDSQGSNLRTHNIHVGGNDSCISNMVQRYGFPDLSR